MKNKKIQRLAREYSIAATRKPNAFLTLHLDIKNKSNNNVAFMPYQFLITWQNTL